MSYVTNCPANENSASSPSSERAIPGAPKGTGVMDGAAQGRYDVCAHAAQPPAIYSLVRDQQESARLRQALTPRAAATCPSSTTGQAWPTSAPSASPPAPVGRLAPHHPARPGARHALIVQHGIGSQWPRIRPGP